LTFDLITQSSIVFLNSQRFTIWPHNSDINLWSTETIQ
jgi:hypothetical protein